MQRKEDNKAQKQKRNRQKITVVILALVCILALVFVKKLYLDRNGTSRKKTDLNGPYAVERIVDGDTIVVNSEGSSVKIRLIGIDTPESVAPAMSGKENSEEGKTASEYLKELIGGKEVYLEYDVSRNDQYGRVLAYVYLDDKTTMIQEVLLSEGYAMVMTYQPNVKYADEFARLQKQARTEKKGFWGSGYYE